MIDTKLLLREGVDHYQDRLSMLVVICNLFIIMILLDFLLFPFNFLLLIINTKIEGYPKMALNRREFIKKSSQMTLGIGTTAIYLPVLSKAFVQKKDEKDEIIDDKKYLSEILYTKK